MATTTKIMRRKISKVTKRAADGGTVFTKAPLSTTKRKDNS